MVIQASNVAATLFVFEETAMGDEFQSDQDFALGVEAFPSERDYKLHCLRHSTSHIMASAVQQIFPEARFGIGPPIKNGF